MRSRTVREGSVGLLVLLGLGLFGGLILWLRGFNPGNREYSAQIEFPNVAGMQVGAPVRYRGVVVGKIISIEPASNGVLVRVEIASSDLLIPNEVLVEANQSGLISETAIDITPLKPLPTGTEIAMPLDPNCNPSLIICDGSRLRGQLGVSIDELIRASVRFTNVFSDPVFFENLNALAKNSAEATAEIAQLSRDMASLTRSVQQELGSVSASAVSTANSVGQAATQIGATAEQLSRQVEQIGITAQKYGQTAEQVGVTVDKYGRTAEQFGNVADELRLTTAQVNTLVGSLNDLVGSNRTSIITTLNNLNTTSEQLRLAVGSFAPLLSQVEQTQFFNNLETLSQNALEASANLRQFSSGEFIQNLETVSENAAVTSTNLREFSTAINNPTNLILLQQTLDSARAAFENAQKITSDLDDLTGDPQFRDNLRNLVEGLSDLVSSTQQLEQQTQMARLLVPLTAAVAHSSVSSVAPSAPDPKSGNFKLAHPENKLKPLVRPASPELAQPSAPVP